MHLPTAAGKSRSPRPRIGCFCCSVIAMFIQHTTFHDPSRVYARLLLCAFLAAPAPASTLILSLASLCYPFFSALLQPVRGFVGRCIAERPFRDRSVLQRLRLLLLLFPGGENDRFSDGGDSQLYIDGSLARNGFAGGVVHQFCGMPCGVFLHVPQKGTMIGDGAVV